MTTNPLQLVVEKLFAADERADFVTIEYGNANLNAAWFPSGYGVMVETTTLNHKHWWGDARVTYGKVTHSDRWPDGTIFQGDDKLAATTADPEALELLLRSLLDANLEPAT